MGLTSSTRSRLVIIGLCVVLMGAAVVLVGEGVRESRRTEVATAPVAEAARGSELVGEVAAFRSGELAQAFAAAPVPARSTRPLRTYYTRRAFPGAPPFIPHPVEDDRDFGRACLQCHETGGYAPRFQAFTPVTPHPDLVNCRQCHEPVRTTATFAAGNAFRPAAPPPLDQAALPGAPPPVPHGLQLRENCLACHGGPAAPPEIRVDHPERVNCRQCHVLVQSSTEWER